MDNCQLFCWYAGPLDVEVLNMHPRDWVYIPFSVLGESSRLLDGRNGPGITVLLSRWLQV